MSVIMLFSMIYFLVIPRLSNYYPNFTIISLATLIADFTIGAVQICRYCAHISMHCNYRF